MLRSQTFVVSFAGWLLISTSALSADQFDSTPRQFRKPSPVEDDAQLYDVQFLTNQLGWAVGEHGVIWQTRDGGRNWNLQSSGVSAALHSVCFLTDQIGWVAGGGTVPFTHQSWGVVLQTKDGGQSWNAVSQGKVPRIHTVKFFGLKQGVIAGDSSPAMPNGLFTTDDEGATWKAATGLKVRGWRAADFRSADRGLVAGPMGKVAVVSEGNLNRALMTDWGLPGIYAVKFDRSGRAWAAGDGGLVRFSKNGGVSWQLPAKPFPPDVRDTFDFRAIAIHKQHIWIAGRPGSVIWHSGDGGENWERQLTGQTVPISGLSFSSETHGCAVGALGMILTTADGGRTWQPARGGGRRAAILSLHTRPEQISVNLQAQLGGEQGYRSVVSLLPRADDGPSGDQSADLDLRIHEATAKAGGSAGDSYWRLPLSIPGLEKNGPRLWEDWKRKTDGKLAEVVVGRLVADLRMWRPSVLIIDQPEPDDALGELLLKAVTRAVETAADPTRFNHHREVNALAPWQVMKVYTRLPDGSTGDAQVDPHQFLPQFRQSTHMAAAWAFGRLSTDRHRSIRREAYRLIHDFDPAAESADYPRGEFFEGIPLSAGGDARRMTMPIDDDLELQRKVARRQNQSRAYLGQFIDDPRMSAQITGQLNDFVNGLTDAEMAVQLAELIDVYRGIGDWDLAEAVATVLVEKFPNEPPAHDAMQWLMHLWISSETTWRRMRQSATGHQRIASDPQQVVAQLQLPRHSRQRARFSQLNPASQQQVLSDLRFVLDATNVHRHRHPVLPGSGVSRKVTGDQTEFPQSVSLLKTRFAELDQVADDTPQLQLSSGTTGPGFDSVRQVRHAESKVSPLRMKEQVMEWHQRATRMAELLSQANAELFNDPKTQFPMAVLLRKRQLPGEADQIYRLFRRLTSSDPWSLSGGCEIWFSVPRTHPPKPLSLAVYTNERPKLDGVLADACWQNAQEIPLTDGQPQPQRKASRPFALLAYDDQFLYFGASFPRVPQTPQDLPDNNGRKHDSDLSHFDRVELLLDVDRDYATYYSFTFDQRGHCRDACWEDGTWNAKYYVQAHGDSKSWRVEAAIPWSELVSVPPKRDDVWNIGIVRTIPAVGRHAWTHPTSDEPRPETFGLVRFD